MKDTSYNAFEHLRRSLLLRGNSVMAMMTAFMDETGDHDDPDQAVVGMAGLLNHVDNWELFDRKWKEALRIAKVPCFKDNPEPYFHTTDFKASRKTFETWLGQRIKQDKLYDKLLRVIESTHAVPFGSIMPIEAWKKLTGKQQANIFNSPYYYSASECGFHIISLTVSRPPEETVDVVFSEKYKVKQRVRKIFDAMRKIEEVRNRISDPIFRDMKKFSALQAADLIAWEMNFEYRRRLLTPNEEPSPAFKRLVRQIERRVTGDRDLLSFHTVDEMSTTAKEIEKGINRRKQSIISGF